jgi:hypothetical protein
MACPLPLCCRERHDYGTSNSASSPSRVAGGECKTGGCHGWIRLRLTTPLRTRQLLERLGAFVPNLEADDLD